MTGRKGFFTIVGNPGTWKCLGQGTPVLRFDGTVVPVESIKNGDKLMGPDSHPRTVRETTQGTGPLWLIEPNKGAAWVCNQIHVMTVVDSLTNVVEDVPLNELEELPLWRREKKKLLISEAVDFPGAETLPIDPYFLGVWFGDGGKSLVTTASGDDHLRKVVISKPDREIKVLCEDIAARYGLSVTAHGSPDNPTHQLVSSKPGSANALLSQMRAVVGSSVNVPKAYMTASRADRAAFLAGWLDTDGSVVANGCVQFCQKRRDWADAVAFIARSLGLRVTESDRSVLNYGTYRYLHISGDFSMVPFRIARKRPPPRKGQKDIRRTGFRATRIEDGAFYGFELDGDGRFLLGDFTITHNTSQALWTFQDALYIASSPNLDQYYTHVMLNSPEAKAAGKKPLSNVFVLDQYSMNGGPPTIDPKTNDMAKIPQRATLEQIVTEVTMQLAHDRAAGRPPSVRNIIIDEATVFWERFFIEIAADMIAKGNGNGQAHHQALQVWTRQVIDRFRTVVSNGANLICLAHGIGASPETMRASFPNQRTADIFVADAHGALISTFEPRAIGDKTPPKHIWQLFATEKSSSKMRGIPNERFAEMRTWSLERIIVEAGFEP